MLWLGNAQQVILARESQSVELNLGQWKQDARRWVIPHCDRVLGTVEQLIISNRTNRLFKLINVKELKVQRGDYTRGRHKGPWHVCQWLTISFRFYWFASCYARNKVIRDKEVENFCLNSQSSVPKCMHWKSNVLRVHRYNTSYVRNVLCVKTECHTVESLASRTREWRRFKKNRMPNKCIKSGRRAAFHVISLSKMSAHFIAG